MRPANIAAPFGRYVHGVALPPQARIVMTSGQLGIALDGTIPQTIEDQAALCFKNIAALLAEAGMRPGDIVKLSAFVTAREDMARYMRARDVFLRDVDPPPASTLMIVSGFSRPEVLVEVEAIAARLPDPTA